MNIRIFTLSKIKYLQSGWFNLRVVVRLKLALMAAFIAVLQIVSGCKSFKVPTHTKNAPKTTTTDGKSTFSIGQNEVPVMDPHGCNRQDIPHGWIHHAYQIEQDGLDVGREVRTTFPSTGPMGQEEITISHTVTRHKSHEVEIDRFTVQTERFLKENNTFLRGCFLIIDESNVHLSLVGFNGAEWERVDETLDSVENGITKRPAPLHLDGTELVGFQLHSWLRQVQQGKIELTAAVDKSWYVPKQPAPVLLDAVIGEKETIHLFDKDISGQWISAVRSGTNRVVVEIFLGNDGVSYIERYPSLHQQRTLANNTLTIPTEYTDPYRGLFSNAYLGFPDAATNATYHIVSAQPVSLDEFAFIGAPKNQQIKQIDAHTLELRVKSGGPDGGSMPTDNDLSETKYINTNDRIIKDALVYLKSAGTKGDLPAHRCDNAAAVIAKVSRIRNTKNFWTDPDKIAMLVAEYVNSILPVKFHTHTMKDAVATLKEGLGDCTEHSVLFASLMRAAKIPTRLVSGMYLSTGGVWVFHMWNEYWDGAHWQSIDSALGPKMSPGANYVALSLGAANFEDHRHNISFFLDRSYSGLEFNLIAAGSNGETLHLARPKRKSPSGTDAVIVEAITLSKRGDYGAAFKFVEKHYDEKVAPINLVLLRTDLLYRVGRLDDALQEIENLRRRTSLPANVFMMDNLSFDILLQQKNLKDASALLEMLVETLGENSPVYLQLLARYQAATGNVQDGLNTLENVLITNEYDTTVIATYLNIVSENERTVSVETKRKAIDRAWYALYLTHYASPEILTAAAGLFYTLGEMSKAFPIIEHALVMTPNDARLLKWHNALATNCAD